MITTFYSFKGGVGRSFALLETAVQLARRGHSVLVWDLDLEAPGIQRIPALASLEVTLKGGTLDLLHLFQEREYDFAPVMTALPGLLVDLSHEAVTEAGGRLSFLLPGALGDGYAGHFAAIDWPRLFEPSVGPGSAFFAEIARRLTGELGYEHVLIDARTGYTELGAVCTFELPDLVALVFTLNAQNVAGIEPVWTAVTQRPSRHGGNIPVFAVANMVPDLEHSGPRTRAGIEQLRKKGLAPHLTIKLQPERLLTDAIPSLEDGAARPAWRDEAEEWRPIAGEIETRAAEIARVSERDREEKRQRRRPAGTGLDPADDARLRREIFERAKTFEEKVADLFRLLGYDAVLDYKRDDMQFDVRLEMPSAAIAAYVLVECKDTARPVTQADVREFASKVDHARRVDKRPYQAILVARAAFANNAHAVAEAQLVQLRTYDELLRSLADLPACVESALRGFQGSALERLYVEQDVLLDEELSQAAPPRHPLTQAMDAWLERSGETFVALLGDFGTGKTSFAKRYAAALAARAKEKPGDQRVPVLIDLREARSTTVSLENILTHHFQSLSPRPFNPQALLHLNREGHLVLIFDGFDEMLGYSDPGQFTENLRQLLRAADGRAKVILTCRTHYFRDRPDALRNLIKQPAVISTPGATQLWEELQGRSGTRVFYLCDFDDAQIADFLQRALPPPADWRAFREEIRRTYNLEDLAERPFLLDLIVKTLPNLRAREGGGTVTIADLYEAYCEEWFRHTDFRLTLVREQKVALVEYLARLVWESPDTRVHYEVLADKAREFFRDRPLTPFEKEKIDYEVRTALFLNRDARGYYSFIHRSFLEFFVARTIRADLRAGNADVLDLKRLTREVAFFLEFWDEARHIPEVCRGVLAAPYRPRVSENALLLLYWHACARVAPLVDTAGAAPRPASDLAVAIREHWRAWSVEPGGFRLEGADLSGLPLPGIWLDGAALAGANLSRAVVREGSFSDARLPKANLAFADARGVCFDSADLSGADLDHADARAADFSGADLSGADLTFTQLRGALLFESETTPETRFRAAGLLGARRLPEFSANAFTGGPTAAEADLALVLQYGHDHGSTGVAWSPDGLCLAVGVGGTVEIWDAAARRLLRTMAGHSDAVRAVAWDASGERVASASNDKTVKVWDAASGRLLKTLGGHDGHDGLVLSVAWAPHGTLLASASYDKTVKVWDGSSGRPPRTLEGHTGYVTSVAWDAAGERLASGSSDGTARIWDVQRGAQLASLEHPSEQRAARSHVQAVAWDAAGKRLAAASETTVFVWDVAHRVPVQILVGHTHFVDSVAWEPGGKRVASGSFDDTVRIWDAESGGLLRTLEGARRTSVVSEGLPELQTNRRVVSWDILGIGSVTWAPDGERVASGSHDGTVHVWKASTGHLVNWFQGYTDRVLCVAWDPRSHRLAAGSAHQQTTIWHASSGVRPATFEAHSQPVECLAWDPHGERLATGSTDMHVKVWDAASGRILRSLVGHASRVTSVAWEPSGGCLASGSDDSTVKLWDVDSGRVLRTLEGQKNAVLKCVAWQPDGGRRLAAASGGTVIVWDASTGAQLLSLHAHEELITSVVWLGAGRLASASYDRTVKVWDLANGRLLRTLQGHSGHVYCVAWDGSSDRLASGSTDGTVNVWEPASGSLLWTLQGHAGWIGSVAWDPSTARIVAGCFDGGLWVWEPSTDSSNPLVRLYPGLGGHTLAVTGDGCVAATHPQALDLVRFADRWALYDVTDVPSRVIPFERIADILRRSPADTTPQAAATRPKKSGAPARRKRSPRRGSK